jgi:hypothetical protein
LNDDEVVLLANLLIEVANDTERWAAWMHAFNRLPMRYPMLQTALGLALATVPSAAVQTYVDCIELRFSPASKSDENRQNTAECLRAFRKSASIERRCELWKIAYDRWLAWGLSDRVLDAPLHEIGRSPLDYAVVGYALESMSDAQRSEAIFVIGTEMMSLENTWHASETDCIAAWNRLLSRFQPYAHATAVSESRNDFLAEKESYWPFPKPQNTYHCLMFRVMSS